MNRFGDHLPHLAENGGSTDAHFEPKWGDRAQSRAIFRLLVGNRPRIKLAPLVCSRVMPLFLSCQSRESGITSPTFDLNLGA